MNKKQSDKKDTRQNSRVFVKVEEDQFINIQTKLQEFYPNDFKFTTDVTFPKRDQATEITDKRDIIQYLKDHNIDFNIKDFQNQFMLEDCLDDNNNYFPFIELDSIKFLGILGKSVKKLEILDEEQQQDIGDYKLGGHPPIFIGEIINSRYLVQQKLDQSKRSTVWLCYDTLKETFTVLKILISTRDNMRQAYEEVEILTKAQRKSLSDDWKRQFINLTGNQKFSKDDSHCIQLLNSFIYQNKYDKSKHFVQVFEVMNINLLKVMKMYNFKGIPLQICRQIVKDILIGITFLHDQCEVIHGGITPQNIIVNLNKKQMKKIGKFGQLWNVKKEKKLLARNQILVRKVRPENYPGENLHLEISDISEDQKEPERVSVIQTGKSFNNEKIEEVDNVELLQQEYQKLIKEKNITNKKKKKNLKKKLKKKHEKIKQNIQEMNQVHMNELVNRIRPQKHPRPFQTKEEICDTFKENFRCKIIGFGTSQFLKNKFQRKENNLIRYKPPELILGLQYDTSVDMWSLGCLVFELLTGDYLFHPQENSQINKIEDLLAQVIELLGEFSHEYVSKSKFYQNYFRQDKKFKFQENLQSMNLKDLLIEYYRVYPNEAELLADFLTQMLGKMPSERKSARSLLNHPWLTSQTTQFYMKEEEYFELKKEYEMKKIINRDNKVILKEGDFYCEDSQELGSELEEDNYGDFYENEIHEFSLSLR